MVYRPAPGACCGKCVFGRGDHADWCDSLTPSERLDRIDRIIALAAAEEEADVCAQTLEGK